MDQFKVLQKLKCFQIMNVIYQNPIVGNENKVHDYSNFKFCFAIVFQQEKLITYVA